MNIFIGIAKLELIVALRARFKQQIVDAIAMARLGITDRLKRIAGVEYDRLLRS